MKSKTLCYIFAFVLIYFSVSNIFVLRTIAAAHLKTSDQYFLTSSFRSFCEFFSAILLIVNGNAQRNNKN